MTLRARTTSPALRLAAAFAAAGLLASGCSKDEPAPAPAPEAPAEAEPPPPASRLGEADAWAERQVTADNVGELLELAGALAAEDSAEARRSAATLRLVAVAALSAPGAEAPAGIIDAETQLRTVLSYADKDDPPLAEVARLFLRVEGAEGIEPLPRQAIAALLAKDDGKAIEADLVRTLAARVSRVLTAARDDAADDPAGLSGLGTRYGNLICDGCHQLGELDPSAAAALLAKPSSEGGLGCDEDGAPAFCAIITELAQQDPVYGEAINRFTVALHETLRSALEPGIHHAGLASSYKSSAVEASIVMPSPFLTASLPVIGAPNGNPRFVALPPQRVLTIGPDGIGIGLRPAASAGGVASPERPGAHRIDLKAEGAVEAVGTRLQALDGSPESPAAVAFVAGQPSGEVTEALALLQEAGAGQLVVAALRAGNNRPRAELVPLSMRTLPEALEQALGTDAAREIIVHVGASQIDIWGPERAVEAAEGKGPITPVEDGGAVKLPGGLEPGWRGTTLARLRLPLPSTDGDKGEEGEEGNEGDEDVAPPAPAELRPDSAIITSLQKGIAFWQEASGVGPVVHVVADAEVPAGVTIEIARGLQEVGAAATGGLKPLILGESWSGVRCPEGEGCPAQLAVAFSTRGVPSSRGITASPKAAAKPAAPPRPKPEPASEENCNPADIQAQMRKNTGRFRFCYEKELQLDKGLAGRINAAFTIGLDGRVASVSLSGDLKNAKVRECIDRDLRKITFAKPKGGACRVNWPFVFRAN